MMPDIEIRCSECGTEIDSFYENHYHLDSEDEMELTYADMDEGEEE